MSREKLEPFRPIRFSYKVRLTVVFSKQPIFEKTVLQSFIFSQTPGGLVLLRDVPNKVILVAKKNAIYLTAFFFLQVLLTCSVNQ